jgi:hypothetical protein
VTAVLVSLVGLGPIVYLFGPLEIIPRLTFSFLAWSSVRARRCEWVADLRSSQNEHVSILAITFSFTALLAFIDILTLGGLLGASNMIDATVINGSSQIYVFVCVTISILIILEFIVAASLVVCLHEIPTAGSMLDRLWLDKMTLENDPLLRRLSILFGYLFRSSHSYNSFHNSQEHGNVIGGDQLTMDESNNGLAVGMNDQSNSNNDSFNLSRLGIGIPRANQYQELATIENPIDIMPLAEKRPAMSPQTVNGNTLNGNTLNVVNNGASTTSSNRGNSSTTSRGLHGNKKNAESSNASSVHETGVYANRSKNPSSLLR